MKTAALIVAGGRGERAGGGVAKQYRQIGGQTVLGHTLSRFREHPGIDLLQTVIHRDDRTLYDDIDGGESADLRAVTGGATRQQSVLAGLEALAGHELDLVLIHDAARPFVDAAVIDRVIAELSKNDGAVPVMALTDTIKKCSAGRITGTVDRSTMRAAQTPQGFLYGAILDAHRKAAAANTDDFTDDAAIGEWAGLTIAMVDGASANTKITTAEDMEDARRRFATATDSADFRTGTGFDVHRFSDNRPLFLCGVEVAHERGLAGHSDADVGLHALCDAILGAVGEGDIGTHFPPSDPAWKGASSDQFVAEAVRRVTKRGGVITNVDITLICEAPRIAPHVAAMRQRIAEILAIDPDRVSVKGTTTEGLGFTGRGEGIAAQATATVRL